METRQLAKCDGRGPEGTGEFHCCWVKGQICQYLVFDGDLPRCSVWDEMDTPEWRTSPIGTRFEEVHPGQNYTCRDWPQKIPEVMGSDVGLCCFS